MIETGDDLLEFFDTDDWGVTITVPGSPGSTFSAIFDSAHFEIDEGASLISTKTPMFSARSADVNSASIEIGDALIINGTNYAVRDIQEDGTGVSEVYLHEA